jgi:hypothetical protein
MAQKKPARFTGNRAGKGEKRRRTALLIASFVPFSTTTFNKYFSLSFHGDNKDPELSANSTPKGKVQQFKSI